MWKEHCISAELKAFRYICGISGMNSGYGGINMRDLWLVLGGIIGGLVIVLAKDFLFKQIKNTVAKQTVEPFQWNKLKEGMLNVVSPTLWAKELSFFNARKLIIVGLALGIIWGYGYYKGRISKPVTVVLEHGKELMIPLNAEKTQWLHINKDGKVHVQDSPDDRIAKIHYEVKIGDLPDLQRALRPYGIDLAPFFTAGGGIGASGAGFEAGVGLQVLKWFKWHYNVFLTQKAIYPLGISYRITDNFDAIAGLGIEYKGGNRIYFGGKFKF